MGHAGLCDVPGPPGSANLGSATRNGSLADLSLAPVPLSEGVDSMRACHLCAAFLSLGTMLPLVASAGPSCNETLTLTILLAPAAIRPETMEAFIKEIVVAGEGVLRVQRRGSGTDFVWTVQHWQGGKLVTLSVLPSSPSTQPSSISTGGWVSPSADASRAMGGAKIR